MSPRKSDIIMDRFIPSSTSYKNYHSVSKDQHFDSNSTKRLTTIDGQGEVRDDSILNLSQSFFYEGSTALSSMLPVVDSADDLEVSHRGVIAEALNFNAVGGGIDGKTRVLNFIPTKMNKNNSLDSTSSNNNSPYQHSIHSSAFDDSRSSSASPMGLNTSLNLDSSNFGSSGSSPTRPSIKKQVKSHIPFRVLDAPLLKNDFYANLVSWSKTSNKIAVGLACNVYIWSEEDGAFALNMPEPETILCVSFCDVGEYILVATKEGRVSLFSHESLVLVDEFFIVGRGVNCITWFPNSLKKFVVGDLAGDVHIFEINNEDCLHLLKRFKCNQQQVCAIAISNDSNQLSIGGNDNCCTIWDIKNIDKPKQKYFLAHQAAVKAIAYCPWSKSLLATGGGSKDRTIRFWHTNTGTLLNSVKTTGQITSLIWSKCKKQIVATFGFGDIMTPILLSVYSYPKMEQIIQVESIPNLRIISAVPSPDSSSVCVACNDETVRFYELWDPKNNIIIESQENGVFGSDLIELCEGISKSGGSIR